MDITTLQKSEIIQLKMGKGPKQTFLKRNHTNGQHVYEKMFNIINCQGIEN
jgi:hypothetical protein